MFHAVLGLAYALFWSIWRAFLLFAPVPGETRMPGTLAANVSPATVIVIAIDGILSISLMLAIAMLLTYQTW